MFTDVPPQENDAGAPWSDGYPLVERRVELDIVRLADVQSPEDGAEAFAPQIVASENRRARPEVAPEARSDPETVRAMGSAVVSNEAVGTSPGASVPQEEHGAEAGSEAPPADTGGGGRGNEPPDDTLPGPTGGYPDDEHDGGEDTEEGEGETARRPWRSGEVRPALRQIVALLAEKEISVDDVLRRRPAQRELLPELLHEDVDVEALARDRNTPPANIYTMGARALNKLIAVARATDIDPDAIPRPHGILPGEREQQRVENPPDPTKIVGPWLGSVREQRGVTYDQLAGGDEALRMKLRRFLGAQARPHELRVASEVATGLGLEEETVVQVRDAWAAERRGDYAAAKAILDSIELPVPSATVKGEAEQREHPGDVAGSVGGTEPEGERMWAPRQQRDALRTLAANGIDLQALLDEYAPTAKSARTLGRILPKLLSDQTNTEIIESSHGEDGLIGHPHIAKVTKRILELVGQGVPQELQHLLQPAGPIRERRFDPIVGNLRHHLEAAGLQQKELAAEIGVNPVTIWRLLHGENPQAHPAMALQPVLQKLVERGTLTQAEANEYLWRYQERRDRLIGRETGA